MNAVFASLIAADGTEAARREHAAGPIGAGDLLSKHRAIFERAQTACRERHCWSPFPELPHKYPNAAQAQAAGQAAYQAHLGSRFVLDQPGAVNEVGEEVSPYKQEALDIRYPQADIDTLFDAAEAAIPKLDKTYRLVPRGVAVCFSRASFPTWNAWPSMMATIQSPQTLGLLLNIELTTHTGQGLQAKIPIKSGPYIDPDFPKARSSTPLMPQVGKAQSGLYGEERFGPISFVIACDDAADALHQATTDVKEFGGLTAFLYSTDEDFIAKAQAAYARAGAQFTINLTGAMPLNFAAAYSDYHVTGLNPAGNASLTHLAFVAGRFCVTQSRRPAQTNASSPVTTSKGEPHGCQ